MKYGIMLALFTVYTASGQPLSSVEPVGEILLEVSPFGVSGYGVALAKSGEEPGGLWHLRPLATRSTARNGAIPPRLAPAAGFSEALGTRILGAGALWLQVATMMLSRGAGGAGGYGADYSLAESYYPTMNDVLRPAMWLGTRMTVLGFACGVIYSVGGLLVDAFTTGLNGGTALAFGALVGMPIVFGAAGFAAGALGGAVVVGFRVILHNRSD